MTNKYQSAVAESEKCKKSLEDTKTSLGVSKAELEQCKKTLEGTIYDQHGKEEKIESEWMNKVNCLNAEIESLSLKNNVVEDKVHALESENQKSLDRAMAAEKQVRKLGEELRGLQLSLEEAKKENKELKSEMEKIQKMKNKIEKKEEELENMKASMKLKENEDETLLENCKKEIENLNTKLEETMKTAEEEKKVYNDQETTYKSQLEFFKQKVGSLEIKLKANCEMTNRLSVLNKDLNTKLLKKINKYNSIKIENNKLNVMLNKNSRMNDVSAHFANPSSISVMKHNSPQFTQNQLPSSSVFNVDESQRNDLETEYELLRIENKDIVEQLPKLIKNYEERVGELYELVTTQAKISEEKENKDLIFAELESLRLKVKALESQLEFSSNEVEGYKKLIEALNASITRTQRENEEKMSKAVLNAHKESENALAELSLKVQSEVQLYRNEISVLRSKLLEYQASELYE